MLRALVIWVLCVCRLLHMLLVMSDVTTNEAFARIQDMDVGDEHPQPVHWCSNGFIVRGRGRACV